MFRHKIQNRMQGPDTKFSVSRNRDALVPGRFCLQKNMASPLAHFAVIPMPAERFHQISAAKVARCFHPIDSTSSLTNCKRTERGFGASKK